MITPRTSRIAISLLAALVLASCAGRRSGPEHDVSGETATTAQGTGTSDAPSDGTAGPSDVHPPVEAGGDVVELTISTPDGRDRSAHLYVPAALTDGPVPLLVALHGGTGWGTQFERNSGYDGLAEANGFLVVYPDGVGAGPRERWLRTWNGGVCCGRSARDDIDDVAFLRQLVEELSDEHDIDPDRVFATGHSNGMIMSYRLACEAADVFVAVAGQAGTLGVDDCVTAEPVSLLHIHGSADKNLPIDGGRGRGLSDTDFPSPREGIRTLAKACGCSTEPTVETDGPAITETWTGCDGRTTVAFVTVDGASHAWMGATDSVRPGGPVAFADYDASLASWTFLAAHPRQP